MALPRTVRSPGVGICHFPSGRLLLHGIYDIIEGVHRLSQSWTRRIADELAEQVLCEN